MTRAGTTLVIIWEERSACVVGMEEAALGTASRGMTRDMDISTAIKREISYVCETGKGQPVRSVSETTTALGVLRIVCLRITRTKDITNVDLLMARKSAYLGGLVPSVARTAFLTAMITTDTTPVHMTEVRRAKLGGTVKTVLCSVFLKMTTREAITPVTSTATKFA